MSPPHPYRIPSTVSHHRHVSISLRRSLRLPATSPIRRAAFHPSTATNLRGQSSLCGPDQGQGRYVVFWVLKRFDYGRSDNIDLPLRRREQQSNTVESVQSGGHGCKGEIVLIFLCFFHNRKGERTNKEVINCPCSILETRMHLALFRSHLISFTPPRLTTTSCPSLVSIYPSRCSIGP